MTVRYVLDTNTCIYWMRGGGQVATKANTFELGELAIAVITLAELYFGAEKSQRVADNMRALPGIINECRA